MHIPTHQLLTGEHAFHGGSEYLVMAAVEEGKYTPHPQLSPPAAALVKSLLQKEPQVVLIPKMLRHFKCAYIIFIVSCKPI